MATEENAEEMTQSERFWSRVWGRYWFARTIFAKRFWNEPFDDYPQTWYYMPRWKPMRKFCRFMCGIFTGHELSETEWGYGGDGLVDRHCRWCDKLHRVPISEARFAFQTFREMRPDKTMIFDEK